MLRAAARSALFDDGFDAGGGRAVGSHKASIHNPSAAGAAIYEGVRRVKIHTINPESFQVLWDPTLCLKFDEYPGDPVPRNRSAIAVRFLTRFGARKPLAVFAARDPARRSLRETVRGVLLAEQRRVSLRETLRGVLLAEQRRVSLRETVRGVLLAEQRRVSLRESLRGVSLAEQRRVLLRETVRGVSLAEQRRVSLRETVRGVSLAEQRRVSLAEQRRVSLPKMATDSVLVGR
jgi:hypothetical protein